MLEHGFRLSRAFNQLAQKEAYISATEPDATSRSSTPQLQRKSAKQSPKACRSRAVYHCQPDDSLLLVADTNTERSDPGRSSGMVGSQPLPILRSGGTPTLSNVTRPHTRPHRVQEQTRYYRDKLIRRSGAALPSVTITSTPAYPSLALAFGFSFSDLYDRPALARL